MTVYPDSSFLVSNYVSDGHSREVAKRLMTCPDIFMTPFHRAELANAIFQWAFHGKMSQVNAEQAYDDFEHDCVSGIWVLAELPEATFDTCIQLARRHGASLGVRTLDSLHVAAALELGATRFWTFDQRQARLAEAEGLATA